jgi:hypothetical protein
MKNSVPLKKIAANIHTLVAGVEHESPGDAAFQCAPPYAQHGLDHEHEDGALETEEQRGDHRNRAERGIDQRQRQHDHGTWNDEQQAGAETADRSVHQPAQIDRELLRLRSGQRDPYKKGLTNSKMTAPTVEATIPLTS